MIKTLFGCLNLKQGNLGYQNLKHLKKVFDGFSIKCFYDTNYIIFSINKKNKNDINNYYDEDFLVIFNGEVVNKGEILHLLRIKNTEISDAELIYYIYLKFGEEFPNLLNGLFNILIINKKNKELLFYCDKNGGIKPCYYSIFDNKLLFSSNIKPILMYNNFPRKLDDVAFYQCLRIGIIVPPRTMFNGIYRLQPGQYLKIKNGSLFINNYYKLEIEPRKTPNLEKTYLNLIKQSVLDRISDRNKKKIGAFLSGGVDSSVVVALMSKNFDEKLNTFSLFIEGSDNEDFEYSDLISKEFGTKNHVVKIGPKDINYFPHLIWHNESPSADLSVTSFYKLAEFAVKKVDVILTGDGNDTIYGFHNYHFYNFSNKLTKFIYTLFNNFNLRYKSPVVRYYLNLYKMFSEEEIKFIFNYHNNYNKITINDIIKLNIKKNTNIYNYLTQIDSMVFGSQGINTTIGKMVCDANSLLLREPFGDSRVQNIINSLPLNLKNKISNGYIEKKYFFKKTIAERLLPNEVVYREKRAPIPPLDKWFINDLGYLREVVIKKLEKDKTINANYIKKIIHNKESKPEYAKTLLFLLMYPIFKEIFIDPDKIVQPKKPLNYYLER